MKTPSCTLIASVSRAILLPGILRYFQHRRKVVALVVLATLRVATCQTSGIRATFTGTQPTTPTVQEGWATPKDTKGSSSQPVILFGSVGVAVASPPQLTATFTVTGFSGTFTPTAVAHYGLDYTVGTVSCTGAAPSETCSVPITFNPTLPGARKDALFLMDGTTRLATVLIGGVGLAPMALTQPGVPSTLYQLPDSHYFYGATVDENGTLYVIQGTSVVSITKAGVLTTLPLAGVSSFTGLAIDGAGVLYIGRSIGATALTTYDTVLGIQGALAIPAATNAPVGVAVDVAGDVFALDEFGPALYKVKPDGTIVSTAINPVFTQPSQLAVDASGDVFIGGYQINELTAGGTQTTINTAGAALGLAVDAAGTLYATRYPTVNGVAQLAATDYTTPIGALDSGSPLGLGLASDGTLFVSNYTVIDKVDRGAGVLNFGSQFIGNTFQSATTTIYNGGNQPLLFSSVALTGQGFTFVTQPGTNCATGTSVPPGGVCSLGIAFSPAHPGAFTGSLTVTTNSLNKVATTQTTTLTATEYGPYLNPTVSPLNFPNQIVNTASIPVVETIANQGDSFAGTLQNVTSSDPAFTIDRSTCPGAVAAGSTCPISITFTPTAVQSYTATITLSYYNSANGAILTNTFTVNGTGIPAPVPQAVLTPTTLAFPNQIIGTTTGSQNITVSNPGNGTLNISGITITGTGASSFAQSTTCASTLAAGASCAITITFKPVGVASYSATVNVADNASGSPQTVTLTGTGIAAPAPVVTLAPASLVFPDTVKSVTSAAQNMMLSNTGNATLNISSITLAGSNPTAFTIGGTCGATLGAGASCNIAVTFTPPGIASYSATVSVTDNATGSPHTATLTGTGIAAPAPVIALAPTSLTFPNTIVGVTSASQTITLTNSGNAALSIIGITLAGANPTSFTAGGTCGASVAAGTSCNITVSFTPVSAATLSATVTVTDNATGSPHLATVTGLGVAPPTPQAVLSSTSLTFASTTVGSTSAAQSVTLSNPGTGPLSITGISIGGTNASSFASTNNCGTTLAVAATCSISVTFSPSAAGSLSATITVADNAAGSPHTATLAGTGAAPDFALTVGASSQTVSSYGGSAQYTFSAAGTSGSYNSPIAFSVTGLPTGVTAVFTPPSITPGTTSATTTLTVTVSSLGASLSGPGALHNQGRSPVPPMTLAGVFYLLLLSKRRRALLVRARLWLMVACMLGLGGVIGCGGGFRSANSVAPGTYTLNVTGTSSTGQHSTNITLIIQ